VQPSYWKNYWGSSRIRRNLWVLWSSRVAISKFVTDSIGKCIGNRTTLSCHSLEYVEWLCRWPGWQIWSPAGYTSHDPQTASSWLYCPSSAFLGWLLRRASKGTVCRWWWPSWPRCLRSRGPLKCARGTLPSRQRPSAPLRRWPSSTYLLRVGTHWHCSALCRPACTFGFLASRLFKTTAHMCLSWACS